MRRLSTRVLPTALAVYGIFAVCIEDFEVVEARSRVGANAKRLSLGAAATIDD
jgi:hypothetical protein